MHGVEWNEREGSMTGGRTERRKKTCCADPKVGVFFLMGKLWLMFFIKREKSSLIQNIQRMFRLCIMWGCIYYNENAEMEWLWLFYSNNTHLWTFLCLFINSSCLLNNTETWSNTELAVVQNQNESSTLYVVFARNPVAYGTPYNISSLPLKSDRPFRR